MQIPYTDIHTHKSDGTRPEALSLISLQPSMLQKFLADPVSVFSCGIHPWFIKNSKQVEQDLALMESAREHPSFYAVGEAGLDKVAGVDFSLQKEVFLKQMELSEKVRKPMVIHCIKAWDEMLQIRKEARPLQIWIFHGFNSSPEMAQQLIKAGCMLSFGKLLLNAETKAARVLPDIPSESFFLETDEADIPIEEIYSQAVKLRGVSLEKLKSQLFDNFLSVFPKP